MPDLTDRPACPTSGCDGHLVAHCRDRHPTCNWSKCPRCGCYGDPATPGRWHTPTPKEHP